MIPRTLRGNIRTSGLRFRSSTKARKSKPAPSPSGPKNDVHPRPSEDLQERLNKVWQPKSNTNNDGNDHHNNNHHNTNQVEKKTFDSASETFALIKQNQEKRKNHKLPYMDLENRSLNLNMPNKDLVNIITKNSQMRMDNRFKKLSDEWIENCERLAEQIPTHKWLDKFKSKGLPKVELIKKEFEYYFERANFSARKIGHPILIGDLVVINEGSTDFFMVASCPEDLDSINYTYINSKGKIIFGPSALIKFRIPYILPRHFRRVIKSMVMLEQKTLDIPPIGISDKNNTRSQQSLPPELRGSNSHKMNQNKNQNQNGNSNSDTNDESPTSISNSKPDKLGTGDDDFIADQASSRLLTNSDVNTYVVPEAAREVYSKSLTKISIQSTDNYKALSTRLELLHRILQFDEKGDVQVSPRNISIFQILHFIKSLYIKQDFENFDYASLKRFSRLVKNQYGDIAQLNKTSNLGKVVTNTSNNPKPLDKIETQSYDLPLYFAVLLNLRKQTRLWKINEQNLVNPITSVIILPISNKSKKDDLINHLKKNDEQIVQYIVSKIRKPNHYDNISDTIDELIEPQYYHETIDLLKDFVIDNLHNDFEAETLVTTLIRKIDSHLQLSDQYYSYEYGKSKCYDILQLLQEFQVKQYENPVNWSLPMEMNTTSTKLNQEYYKYLEENGMNQFKQLQEPNSVPTNSLKIDDLYEQDPMKESRQEFEDPIFCIDSETAHEIDDGISIRDKNSNQYQVTIHIANPASYIQPTSSISQIALSKGVTTYLPEGPIKMLPDFISDLSGLGITRPKDNPIRTFAIEFVIDKDFNTKPLAEILLQIETTGAIKFYNTYNYPKGYNYNHVDKILHSGEDQFKPQLDELYSISEKLKQIRIELGGAHDFEFDNNTVNVEYLSGNSNSSQSNQFNIKSDGSFELTMNDVKIEMTSSTGFSKSQVLVSEMMIIGNHLTSLIGKKNNIPIIYRNQIMNLPLKIVRQIKELSNNLKPGEEFKDMIKIIRIMNSAKIDGNNNGHESLGLQSYSQITSPLRRYSDLINQWQIQNKFNQKQSDFDFFNIINHLQARDLINKQHSRFSTRFWQGIMLREYFKLQHELPQDQLIDFKLFVNNAINKFKYSTSIHKFSDFKSYIELDPDTDVNIEKGEILSTTTNVELQRMDFIENEFSLKYVNRTN